MLIPSLTAPLPVQWLKRLGVHDILGVVRVEEWDYSELYFRRLFALLRLLLGSQDMLQEHATPKTCRRTQIVP